MTDEQRESLIRSLIAERAGYEARGLPDRVKAVDEQLRHLGHQAKAPAARAERRPASKPRASRGR